MLIRIYHFYLSDRPRPSSVVTFTITNTEYFTSETCGGFRTGPSVRDSTNVSFCSVCVSRFTKNFSVFLYFPEGYDTETNPFYFVYALTGKMVWQVLLKKEKRKIKNVQDPCYERKVSLQKISSFIFLQQCRALKWADSIMWMDILMTKSGNL